METPQQLTQPIRDAFGERAPPKLPTPDDNTGEVDEGPIYDGPLQFVGLAFAPEGGQHIVFFEYDGERASYITGDELPPDGKILDSIRRVGEGKYEIRFRSKDGKKIEQQTYEVEQL